MVRLKDIALRAGVSVMTVSKALRETPDVAPETRARIRLLAQQMGYMPDSAAQVMRSRKTRLFGLAVSSVTNPLYAEAIGAIEERARELGYDLLVAFTRNVIEREETAVRRFLYRRVDGLFLAPVYRIATEAPLYRELLARRVPTVLLGHTAPFCAQFPAVETDDLLAGYSITEHLLKLGHRRIAFFAGPPGTAWSQERFEGYRRALREVGLDVDDKLVFEAGRSVEDGAKAAMQMINESADATAVQAVGDWVAIGCAEVLLRQGIQIPQDFSVAGFGNYLIGEHFRIPLTTAAQQKARLGTAALEVMQQLLSGVRPEPRRLPAELIVRASTGTAPATPPLKRLTTNAKDIV